MKMKFSAFFFNLCILSIYINTIMSITTVHIVPHSHMDAGWLKTKDEYYLGITSANCVKCTFDSVLKSLLKDDKRTFAISEVYYFEKWYSQLSELEKLQVKNLIKSNKIEFVNGGWVMHDEATSTFYNQIDQLRFGNEFIRKEFNYKTKVAWQLDPFGHSLMTPYVFAKLDYENLVMVRIDYREKEKRKEQQFLEFDWKPLYDLDKGETSIFTHITYGHYSPDEKLPAMLGGTTVANLRKSEDKIYDYFVEVSNAYKTDELMFLYGDDFTFKYAESDYSGSDSLIELFNNSTKYKEKIRFIYSTPSDYFSAVKKTNTKFPTMENIDFYPYCDKKQDYWTGYFTSRPYIKGYGRDISNFLIQSSRLLLNLFSYQFYSFRHVNKHNIGIYNNYTELRKSLALVQHHDALSGTERDMVAEDYINTLTQSMENLKDSLTTLLNLKDKQIKICLDSIADYQCKESNMPEIGKDDLTYVIVNPGLDGQYPYRLYLKDSNITIHDELGNEMIFDAICYEDPAYCDIILVVSYRKESLYSLYTISQDKNINTKGNQPQLQPLTLSTEVILFSDASGHHQLTYNAIKGLDLNDKKEGTRANFNIHHGKYTYNQSSDEFGYGNRNGAYLFATNLKAPINFDLKIEKSSYYIGKNLNQINLVFEKSLLKLKVYKTENFRNMIETETIIQKHTQPQNDEAFVFIVDTDIDNNIDYIKDITNTLTLTNFWTDANAVKMVERIQNTRFNWNFEVDDEISSNMYPVNSAISIRRIAGIKKLVTSKHLYDGTDNNSPDDDVVTVFNDRPQAGTSIKKGQIQLLLDQSGHRDDRKGLADGIFESQSSGRDFAIKHYISLNKNYNHNWLQNYITKKPINFTYQSSKDSKTDSEMTKNLINQKSIINEFLEVSNDMCDFTLYYVGSGFLLQVFNKNDFYFSMKSEDCVFNFKPIKSTNKEYTLEEVNLLGIRKNLRYPYNNKRIGKINLSKKLRLYNNVIHIKSMDIKNFLLKSFK